MKLFARKKNEKATNRFEHLLRADDIPSFPSVVAEAIEKVARPDVDLGDVASTISADPKITLAVLKLANSPAFAPRTPITSVPQAVVLLGRNQLESLLIASGVAEVIPSQATTGYSPHAFWSTAALRAAVAAEMASLVAPSTEYEQFTAALLQDMAQPILFHHDPTYADLVVASCDSHHELARREREVLGWTHPEIGGMLCENWGLPEQLTASVSAHHDETIEGFEIAQWAALIEGPDTDMELLIAEATRRFGVDEDTVLQVFERAAERAADIAGAFH